MALPLILAGAAALSVIAVKKMNEDRTSQQALRQRIKVAQSYSSLAQHESPVAIYPSDFLVSESALSPEVTPQIGAIVCCGIGGILDHTGIWIGNNMIVELSGSGLIKAVTSERFIKERSGKQIFIACDSLGQPLVNPLAAKRASDRIYQYSDYHMLNNNCHHFIWQCFQPEDEGLTTFKTLNKRVARFFDKVIYWDVCSLAPQRFTSKTRLKSFERQSIRRK